MTNYHLALLTGDDGHFEIAQAAGQDIHASISGDFRGGVLEIAATLGDPGMLDACFTRGFNPDIFAKPWLHVLPSTEVAERVLKNYFDKGGKKPTPTKVIELAARAGDVATAKHIIAALLPNRVVNIKKKGFNSYHAAAVSGQATFLEKADAKGHDPTQSTQDFSGLFQLSDPLLLALRFENYDVAEAIVERAPDLVTKFRTHQMLIRHGHVDGLEYLVKKGVRFDSLHEDGQFFEPGNIEVIELLVENGWDIGYENKEGSNISMHLVGLVHPDRVAHLRCLLKKGLKLVSSSGSSAMIHLISKHPQYRFARREDVFEGLFRSLLSSGQIELDEPYNSAEGNWKRTPPGTKAEGRGARELVFEETSVRSEVINLLPEKYVELLHAARSSAKPGTVVHLDAFASDFEEKYERATEQGLVTKYDPFALTSRVCEGKNLEFWLGLLEGRTDLLDARDKDDFNLLGYYLFSSIYDYVTRACEGTLSTEVVDWFLSHGFSLETKYLDRQLGRFQDQIWDRMFSSDNHIGKTSFEIIAMADISVAMLEDSEERRGTVGVFSNFVRFLQERTNAGSSLRDSVDRKVRLRALHGFNSTTVAVLGFGKAWASRHPITGEQMEELGVLCLDYRESAGLSITMIPSQDLSMGDYTDVGASLFIGLEVLHATAEHPERIDERCALRTKDDYAKIPSEFWQAVDGVLATETSDIGDGFYAQAAGPLASGMLVFGKEEKSEVSGSHVFRGADTNQDPQESAVVGEKLASFDGEPQKIELDFSRDVGSHYLIASYD